MSDISKHQWFYVDTVTFLVEECLFKVPRQPFETESVVFRDMFLLPIGDPYTVEGKNDDNPIHLMGIKKDDFEQLLSVLFHRTHGMFQKPLPKTITQWVPVLKLATLWGFGSIRRAAIDALKDKVAPMYKIVLGDRYDLDFESWTLPAMHDIVRRHKPISIGEAKIIGLEYTLKLASVREQLSFEKRTDITGHHSYGPTPGRRPDVEALDFTCILRDTFNKTSSS